MSRRKIQGLMVNVDDELRGEPSLLPKILIFWFRRIAMDI